MVSKHGTWGHNDMLLMLMGYTLAYLHLQQWDGNLGIATVIPSHFQCCLE